MVPWIWTPNQAPNQSEDDDDENEEEHLPLSGITPLSEMALDRVSMRG